MSWLERLETKGLSINRLHEDLDSGFTPASAYRLKTGTVTDSMGADVVMSPVFWVVNNFTEADAVVQRRTRTGQWERTEDHALEMLLEQPNPFYDGDALWSATLVSYLLEGDAYWQKVRNAYGDVIGLWYLPHFLVEPVREDGSGDFISHYEYTPDPRKRSDPVRLPVRDVVHLRYGLDPRDPKHGMSRLKPVLREVMTDREASTFSAAILSNMGVPGGVIAPKDAAAVPTDDDVKDMKEYMKNFRGGRRGDWLVLGTPTEIGQFGFNPQNLMLGNLRDISEERVCAALGIHTAVVGFGSGNQQVKVGATMRELRQSAWHNALIPQQNKLSKQVTRQLLPEFQAQTRRFRVRFDRSHVSAFQEEETERARRVALLVEKVVLRVDRGQDLLGLEVDSSQDVYLRPSGVVPVRDGEVVGQGVVEPPGGNDREEPAGDGGNDGEKLLNRAAAALAAHNGKG